MTSPVLARDLPDGSRRYVHPVTGEEVPSVTTILSVIAKPALTGWAARTAAAYAVSNWDQLAAMRVSERTELIRHAHDREAQAAARTGDAVHAMIEAWAAGRPYPELPKQAGGFASQYAAFLLEARPRFLENEVTLWSRADRYAGTCDWIAEIGGTVILGDTKTGRRVYPEAALQVSALAHAEVIVRADGTEEEMPVIGGLAVLHVRPRSWQLITVSRETENVAAFLAARDIWGWQHEVAPAVYQ